MTNYEGTERRTQAWHLDKKVPIVIMLMLIGQGGMFIWWASELNGIVKDNMKVNIEQGKRMDAFEQRERDNVKLSERVVRVETIVENILHTVNRIDESIPERKRNGR